MRFSDRHNHSDRLIAAALAAADPARALSNHWDPTLNDKPCVLLSIGKASLPMTREALAHLTRVRSAVATVPPDQARDMEPGVHILVCDHPFPTDRNVAAATEVAVLVSKVREDEHLIALISGGGSAHLALPAGSLTIDDIASVTRALQRAGAAISDLNCVRKHCERLKGGRLAALSGAGRLVAYILSDVLGDKLDVISSGPTAPDPTTYADALAILDRFALTGAAPAITAHLRRGTAGQLEETPKPGHPAFARVTNTIIASNGQVVDAIAVAARSLGFHVAGIENAVEGEAAHVGGTLAARAAALAPGSCWIMGGETTVTVGDKSGQGGPSQELALSAAIALDSLPDLALLAFSTDGRDGPTDAAGALITGETCQVARAKGLDPGRALENHDSHTLLDQLGALIRVPPTGTNLNHIAVLMKYAP